MRRALALVALVSCLACGGSSAPAVAVGDVRGCLQRAAANERWSEIPASDTGTVYAIDFGENSVQIYVEPDADAVAKQKASIRAAEDEVGNTAPEDRVILRARGNVLVSWANRPSAEQERLVRECTGVA